MFGQQLVSRWPAGQQLVSRWLSDQHLLLQVQPVKLLLLLDFLPVNLAQF